MIARLRNVIVMLVFVLSATMSQAAEVDAAETGFEPYVRIEDWDLPLRLSGSAVVSRRFLPFYSVALYVGREAADADKLLRGMMPCRIAIHWLAPSVNADDAAAYWQERLTQAIVDAQTRNRLKPSIDRLIRAFGTAKRDDTLVLEYHPDRGLRVWANDKPKGQFAGLDLNSAVLAIWLDPKVSTDIRNPLLGLAIPDPSRP